MCREKSFKLRDYPLAVHAIYIYMQQPEIFIRICRPTVAMETVSVLAPPLKALGTSQMCKNKRLTRHQLSDTVLASESVNCMKGISQLTEIKLHWFRFDGFVNS